MCTGTHPFIPAPNTARVRMVYNELGQVLENVFYFSQTGPFTSAELIALNSAVVTEWNSLLRPDQSNQCTLEFVESTALDSAAGLQETQPVGTIGGSTTTGPAPTSVTLAVKFTTGLTGRSQRGRMYWIGTTISNIVGDSYEPASCAAILSAVAGFFGAVTAAVHATHSVVSYCSAGAWRTVAQVTPVTGISLSDCFIDSQRRRLAGRGI